MGAPKATLVRWSSAAIRDGRAAAQPPRPHSVASPRNEKKPITSVIVGHEHRRGDRGIDSRLVERDRDEDAGEPRDQIVDDHRQRDHDRQIGVVEDDEGAEPDQQRQADAVGERRCGTRGRSSAAVLELVSWLVASARTDDRQRLRAPHCRPCPRRSASARRAARRRAISPWNSPTTDAAMIAVPRLTTSQVSRVRTVRRIGSLMSPSPAPDRRSTSSPASCWMMWTTSSTVIMPTSRPGAVDHRGGDQRVFLEAERDLLLVHVDRDQRLLALHHVGDRDARAACAGSRRARRCRPDGGAGRPRRLPRSRWSAPRRPRR